LPIHPVLKKKDLDANAAERASNSASRPGFGLIKGGEDGAPNEANDTEAAKFCRAISLYAIQGYGATDGKISDKMLGSPKTAKN
jgi:hypothetical protein